MSIRRRLLNRIPPCLSSLSVRARLALGLATGLVLSSVVSGVAFTALLATTEKLSGYSASSLEFTSLLLEEQTITRKWIAERDESLTPRRDEIWRKMRTTLATLRESSPERADALQPHVDALEQVEQWPEEGQRFEWSRLNSAHSTLQAALVEQGLDMASLVSTEATRLSTTARSVLMWLLCGSVILIGAYVLLARTIVLPITSLSRIMTRLAGGETTVDVPNAGKGHEIAQMCHAVQVFKENLIERHQAEQLLKMAMVRANEAAKSKSEFLANMSHEIRTPMTSILGYGELLYETGDLSAAPEERVYAIETILRNGDHLLRLINDILDISKLEAGRMSVESIECSPVEIAHDVIDLMKVKADHQGIELSAKWEPPIPSTVLTDPTRVRQILMNMIGNAVKFTEQGSVTLTTRARREHSDKVTLEWDIRDTGIGMTADQADGLFQPFTQADASTSRTHGGTGLGLSLSRRIARMLGGDIDIVETELGRGTLMRVTIEVEVPDPTAWLDEPGLERRPHRAPPPKDPTTLQGKILLAEDNLTNRRLVESILKRAGFEVETAENGAIAVDKAMEASSQEAPFDVILMDMQMPVLDGYDATRKLRSEGYTRPIVALTAHSMESDRKKCLNAGCDDHSTKPIDKKVLMECLGNQIAKLKE